ncbi:MAG: hypothetical protein AVDCRST_MAG69-1144, partial [uncultured Solirubrobacteraceae bacterium]
AGVRHLGVGSRLRGRLRRDGRRRVVRRAAPGGRLLRRRARADHRRGTAL